MRTDFGPHTDDDRDHPNRFRLKNNLRFACIGLWLCVFLFVLFTLNVGEGFCLNLFGANVKKKNKTIYAMGDIYNIISFMVHGVESGDFCVIFYLNERKKRVNNCTPC